jgi:hypothetical protein
MKSKTLFKFINALEQEAFDFISEFLDKVPELEFVEHDGTTMSFKPDHEMKGIKKWIPDNAEEEESLEDYKLVAQGPDGNLTTFELNDFAVIPLHDLIMIIEEIEAYERQKPSRVAWSMYTGRRKRMVNTPW